MEHYWLLVALIAPLLWAGVNVIDLYFVSSVYEDEYDGAAISGIFQGIVWLPVVFGVTTFVAPEPSAALAAFAGGVLFLSAYFFYFRAMFAMGDAAVIQVLWNLSVPTVTVLAWLVLGEHLSFVQYAGIAIAFCGAMVLSADQSLAKDLQRRDGVITMIVSMFLLSMAMVLEGYAYTVAGVSAGFWSIFLVFSAGAAAMGLVASFMSPKGGIRHLQHIGDLSRRYFVIFLTAEGLSLCGAIMSQYAINIAPSVAFVAVAESIQPIFVMVLSLFAAALFLTSDKEKAREIYRQQLVGTGAKVFAVAVMAVGIWLIS